MIEYFDSNWKTFRYNPIAIELKILIRSIEKKFVQSEQIPSDVLFTTPVNAYY